MNLITQRSVVQIHPPQPLTRSANPRKPKITEFSRNRANRIRGCDLLVHAILNAIRATRVLASRLESISALP
jgi:hypothetical protein